MCFGGRNKEDEAGAAKSRELDKIIRADEKRMQREVKLLLLGTPPYLAIAVAQAATLLLSSLPRPAVN